MTRRDTNETDPTVVRAIEEGVLIARSALTIATANRIIVSVLGGGDPLDDLAAENVVRDEMGRLAGQQEQDARRMRSLRRRSHRAYGDSQHQFDYRPDDAATLRIRERTYRALSALLERLRGEDGVPFVESIVAAARLRAVDDVGSAAVDKLGFVTPPDDAYDDERAERLRQLRDVDLAGLKQGGASDSRA